VSGNVPLNFDDVALSDAQGVLVRILKMALLEDEKCASVLLAGLQSADKESLPTEPEDLLDFARAHLRNPLTREIGPNLTVAVLGDLNAELAPLRTGKNAGSPASLKVDTPHVEVPVRSPKSGASPDNVIGRLPFPSKLRRSVANLVRTASMRIRAAVASAKTSPSMDRLPVLLVHPDRLVRASIARALVNARFDVTGFDASPQLIPALRSRNGACIAILDVCEKGVEATLRSLAISNADVRILAWTDIEGTVAESVLGAAGMKRFVVLPRAAAEIEVVDAARKLAAS
jgi:hypothetical protein